MFSKSCEYGIRASIYVAKHSLKNRKVSLKEVALHTDAPAAFMAKILQKLTRTEILSSLKGPTGGFFVPFEKIETISVLSIVSRSTSCNESTSLFLTVHDRKKTTIKTKKKQL